jgi:DNA-binding Lrp family transcriptional regulator
MHGGPVVVRGKSAVRRAIVQIGGHSCQNGGMHPIDQRLVTLLRHDARRSVSDLAAALGVSRATVRARMERLARSGDILGYTVILRADAVELPVRGIMMRLAGSC